MEYEVKIKSAEGYAIHILKKRLSDADLNWVRRSCGIRVPTNKIQMEIYPLSRRGVTCHVSEEVARESGRFGSTNVIYVFVPHRFLNRFATRRLQMVDKENTTQIERVTVRYGVDQDDIVDAWKKSGYPLYWGFPEGDQDVL